MSRRHLFITAHGNMETAVQALKVGAFDEDQMIEEDAREVVEFFTRTESNPGETILEVKDLGREGAFKGIIKYTEDPIVSSDIIHDSHSSIFAGPWTTAITDTMVKVVSWYDNENSYSVRCVDLLAYMAEKDNS